MCMCRCYTATAIHLRLPCLYCAIHSKHCAAVKHTVYYVPYSHKQQTVFYRFCALLKTLDSDQHCSHSHCCRLIFATAHASTRAPPLCYRTLLRNMTAMNMEAMSVFSGNRAVESGQLLSESGTTSSAAQHEDMYPREPPQPSR
jgi:hypothetical protein